MTAVLSAVDALRKEDIMSSVDDSHVNYSPSSSGTDWKSKYYEVADMLSETRNELDDFHTSSKELEEELERELQRTEKAQQDLKVKLERAEAEREEWKSKFMTLQTNHNTATTSLQRELDRLRADHQKIKIQLRELEMGNDDLERNERAVTSSLADVESKYSRALEEKILLEHELLDKAHVEEECQRFKDELRDANAEVAILRDQLEAANARSTSDSSSSISSPPTPASSLQQSAEDLLQAKPPSDLQLADFDADSITPISELPPVTPRPSTSSVSSLGSDSAGRQALLAKSSVLARPGFATPPPPSSSSTTTLPTRISGLPTPTRRVSPTRIPPRTTVTRPTPRVPSSVAAGSIPIPVSRSKGVQMVSEMRARVKNLEQKIHTRVPRMRIGSTSANGGGGNIRPNPPSTSTSRSSNLSALTPSSSGGSSSGAGSTDLRRHQSLNASARRSPDKRNGGGGGDVGWVLVMEDSPSPVKNKRAPGYSGSGSGTISPDPVSPTSPRGAAPLPSMLASAGLSRSTTLNKAKAQTHSQGRTSLDGRPGGSALPMRPTTPTFLPLPTASLYASTGGGGKRSTGPSSGAYAHPSPKRASLGASRSPVHDVYMSDSGIPAFDRSTSAPLRKVTAPVGAGSKSSGSPSSFRADQYSNVTVRAKPTNVLAQSRIGKPRGSTGGGEDGGRTRSGTTAARS